MDTRCAARHRVSDHRPAGHRTIATTAPMIALAPQISSTGHTASFSTFFLDVHDVAWRVPAAPGGSILTKPAARTRQIELIGDSFTAGYGNMSTTRDCSDNGGQAGQSGASAAPTGVGVRELRAARPAGRVHAKPASVHQRRRQRGGVGPPQPDPGRTGGSPRSTGRVQIGDDLHEARDRSARARRHEASGGLRGRGSFIARGRCVCVAAPPARPPAPTSGGHRPRLGRGARRAATPACPYRIHNGQAG